jgi:outer membrane protein TolC
MRDPLKQHEPTPEFAGRLESQIANEVRRRNQQARSPRWAAWSPAQVLAAVAAMVIVSAGVGGAAVAVAYEAQNNQLRDQLVSTWEQRADLARQRLEMATRDFESAQRRFEVGIGGSDTILQKGVAVAEAQAEVDLIALDLEEIGASGREPRSELSAPRVAGRDFVGERLRIQRSGPEKALEVARKLEKDVQARVEIGVADAVALEVSHSQMLDVETALETVQRKIAIREQFLGGLITAVEADLRGLEAEAEQRIKALSPKIELARREVARLEQRVEVGLSAPVDVAEANLHRLELETELSRAELDLALIRKRIQEHRG